MKPRARFELYYFYIILVFEKTYKNGVKIKKPPGSEGKHSHLNLDGVAKKLKFTVYTYLTWVLVLDGTKTRILILLNLLIFA